MRRLPVIQKIRHKGLKKRYRTGGAGKVNTVLIAIE